jgi:hypothetical protein
VVTPNLQYAHQDYRLNYSPALNLSGGFLLTLFMSVMRLRYAWWPFHPIGYLMIDTFPGYTLWFSIFVGWLFKKVVLRIGGAQGYLAVMPLVIGVIVDESVAAGFWMAMGILLSSLGLPYRAIVIMPG